MRGLLSIYAFVFSVFSVYCQPVFAQQADANLPSQHSILQTFFESTGGTNWSNKTGWLGDAGTECSWYGVSCNGQGQVTSLNLQENNLSGTLPDSIGQLTQLQNVVLYGNEIGGAIPSSLGNLSQLGGLALFNNNFTGTIPVELGQLSNLNYMDLGGNQLTGSIPSSLGSLSNLSSLYLYNNQLSGFIPGELGQLGSLTILNLSGNQLTGYVPQSILDLNLTELSLSNNQFFVNTQERAALLALYNATGGDSWTNKTGWLGEPGTECSWFGVICNSGNSGGNVTAVQLNNNNLVGTLPVALKDLVRLGDISFGGNKLTGSIPAEYGQLVNLVHLGLWSNQLSGGIPASLGNLTNLHWLSLADNKLSGTIPAELGNMSGLRGMFLSHNQLTGTIPVSLGNLSNLQQLKLGNNLLSGTIPDSLGNLGNLEELRLENNLLSGSIPATLGNLSKLNILSLNNNLLTGAVPSAVLNNNNLDLNLWANMGLDIEFGNAGACEQRATLTLDGPAVSGNLTPFEDCFNESQLEMVDFLSLQLQSTTVVQLHANSTNFWPRIGVRDQSSEFLMTDLSNNNDLKVELMLPAGTYVPYTTGGTYNHQYNVNVPATGPYSISALSINEPQVGCHNNQSTAVAKGVLVEANLTMDDCLSGAPNRPYDSYSIYLEAGESVSVALTSQFPAVISRFVDGAYIQALGLETGVTNGFTVVASNAGTHRFDVQTLSTATQQTGSYTLHFTDALLTINPENCQVIPEINLAGEVINGSLDLATDCLDQNRLVDKYILSLDSPVAFKATVTSQDFDPFTGVYKVGDGSLLASRSVIGSTVSSEYLLPPGDYWLYASSRLPNGINPPVGAYSFSLGAALTESNATCEGAVWTMPGVSINGSISSADCVDTVAPDAATVSRYIDSYLMYVAANETFYVTIDADFDYILSWFSNGAFRQRHDGVANQRFTMPISRANLELHSISVLGLGHQETGNYTVSLSRTPPVEETVSQRDILIALYNSTNGANWTNKTGWLGAEGTECSWFGISCENDQIVHINLRENNLTGTLPAQLGNLVSLRSLDLGGNALTGTIPSALGNLSNLTGIWVWGNQLSGAIPTELGNLAQLRNINLSGNNLSGSIPSTFGNLTNLTELELSYNQLTGQIPSQLGNLTAATTINLRNNLLSGDVPQSVLDIGMGVVNLWGNIALNIAKGNPAACVADAQNPLVLNGTTQGTLTPFTDCYVEDANAMVDFYQIDLSAASGTTQLRIEGNAVFWPHLGILGGTIGTEGFDDRDVMQTQVGQPPFAVEVALRPGKYTLYVHGGEHTGAKNENVPAIGQYSLNVSAVNELQSGCRPFNNTWVTKGVEINGAFSTDDCLDTFGDPDRLFDSYAIYLEQGESVLVTLEAEIASQLLSFNSASFVAGTTFAAPNTKQGLTVTAAQTGWHRFAPYTTNNNPLATGAYTIRFMEPPVFGSANACTQNLPVLALGGAINGALSAVADCFNLRRLSDRYVLDITEPSLFRAQVQTDGFTPLLGLYPAGDSQSLLANRGGIDNTTSIEFYLVPGQYWLFVSSASTILDQAIEGNYTLESTEQLALNQMQSTGCQAGDTRLTIAGSTSLTGQITQNDCPDTTAFGNQTNNPERDGYQLALPAGTVPLQVSLSGDFNTRLSIFRNGVFVNATTGAAGQSSSLTLTEGGSYQINVLGQQGPNNGGTADRGNYTLSINSAGVSAESEIVQISFSYTFSGSSNSGQIGVSDHVLTGVVDAVMLADGDTFEVRGLRSASLGGAAYSVGDMPGIIARRANQPALMSLSGNRLDVQICPSGFTAGNDCAFGAEGGFLVSDAWPATGSQAGQGGALAGHPQFGGSYRDRDIPINKAQWSAQPYTPSVSQRDILLALFNSTNGASWTNKTGWLGAAGTECSWFGIVCESGEIVHINLKENNLTGTLPLELGNLTSLRSLDLGGNRVTGTIPAALGNLSNLTGLWLWGNQLEGNIPTQLGNLLELRYLSLGGNNLSGAIPVEIGALAKLDDLDLAFNTLTGQVPSSLANLVNATTISLRNNLLTGDVPQSVLDLGTVNLWANVGLNIAKGNPAACLADAQNPLVLNGTTQGTLTPFTDCYVEDTNAMVDFYEIDLSQAQGTTQLQIQASTEFFGPHIGILGGTMGAEGFEDRDVMQTQAGQSPFTVEAALAPGKYTLYVHGGAYTHDKNVNVPATGSYSLNVSTVNELQMACPMVGEYPQFNRTWVTKGTEVNAALSADDCLDTFNDPDRLFDSYAIYLEQGESVLVTLEAEIATQLLSFAESGFVSASAGAANVKHGLTVTAQVSGWHRFAPYTTNNNPTETGAYTIRFMEPPVFGNPSACASVIPTITPGAQVNGAMDSDTDCFVSGRLSDLQLLSISEPTLFRADVQTDGFEPMIGITPAGNRDLILGTRVGVNNATQIEFYLAPGQYWLFVSSRLAALDMAVEGNYTLSLGAALPLSQMQTGGCVAGDTRLVIGSAITLEGAVAAGDCTDLTDAGNQNNNPERDSYQLLLPAGSVPVRLDLSAQFNARLGIFRNGVIVQAPQISAGQSISTMLTESGSYQINVLGQQGPGNGGTADRGNYTLNITPVGNSAEACSALPLINLNNSIEGSLDRTSDCYRNGRLSDRYSLTLNETTLFRVSQIGSAFQPFTGIYNADGSRLLGSRISGASDVFTEYLLPAGQYLVEASSRFADALSPPAGSYTLQVSASLALENIQTNPQFGPVRLTPKGTLQGVLATTDNKDLIGAAAEQNRYVDGYSFAVPAGETVLASVQADFPVLFAKWQGGSFSDLAFAEAISGGVNEPVSFVLSGPANYILYVIGNQDGVTGPYTLTLNAAQDPATVRSALLALYSSTNGDSWTNNSGWLGAEGTECSWFGIGCEDGQIVSIQLDQNNLVGILPNALGDLGSLRILSVGGNQLSGSLPDSLGDLTKLTGIWAWGNQLSGELSSRLASLSEIRNINLSGNNFSGSIPSSLGNLGSLIELDLGYNQLTGQIPAQLGNLVAANSITLRNNLLSGDVPQSVLDLGMDVVNLWGNINLNLAKGNVQACVADEQNPLVLNGTTQGELTPFTDCYVDDANAMFDFYLIDLSQAQGTTQLRIEGNSTHFWPHMGVLQGVPGAEDFEDYDVMETQVGQPPFAVEVALAPGRYTFYVHGGSYTGDKNENVPATGAYGLNVSTITELQSDCRPFNNTWVTKGVEINGAFSTEDCLDTFNDPGRLFDSYAIYLEQGESVLVTLEAEIASQLLSFNSGSFVAGTQFGAPDTKQGLTVTATQSGWHRFAPYTTNNNPTETGAYTIRFMEPPVFGNPSACASVIPTITPGAQVNGALDSDTDCFVSGRLSDLQLLSISEPTLFRADVQTDGFEPMIGITPAGNRDLILGTRVGVNNATQIEFYLAPGQYWLFVSSRLAALDMAVEGNYTLSLGAALPLSQMQTGGCVAGDTRLVIGSAITLEGAVDAGDCTDLTDAGNQNNNPERDSYQLLLPVGSVPVQVTLTGDFNTRLSVFRNGVSITPTTALAGQPTSQILTAEGTYQINVLGQQGPGNGETADRGNYKLRINRLGVNAAPSGAENTATLNEDGSYTFSESDFGFRDSLDYPPNNFIAVQITTPPFAGSLALDGNEVVAGQLISKSDLSLLVFRPETNEVGDNYAAFEFQVQDDGGIIDGSVDTDPSPKRMTLTVIPINDAPSGVDSTIDLVVGNQHTFSAGNFGFSDTNDNPQNTLLDVTILTMPGAGKLLLGEQELTTETVIPAADISKLVFDPVNPAISANFATVTFKVRDNGGVANGGIDTDPTPNTLTFGIVSGQNEPAVLSGATTGSITEDSGTFTATGQLVVTDIDDDPVVIAQSDVAGTYGNFNISADGSWSYTANNDAMQVLNTDVPATESFQVSTLDGTTGTVTIALSGVNDAPVQQINESATQISDTDGIAGELVNLSVTTTDIDGTIASTVWQVGGVTVATGATASIILPDGFSGVLARSTDNSGAFVDSLVVINVIAPAAPVVVIAGGNRQIADTNNQLGETVSLSATATDTDGTIVSTDWLVDGQVVASGLSADIALPNGNTDVSFRATDNVGLVSVATVTINVGAANVAPVISIAGGDRNLNDTDGIAGETASFSATATDSDGTLIATEWLLNGAPVATGLNAEIVLPDGGSQVSFRAIDNGGLSSETSVSVNVSAAIPPSVSIEGGDRSIADTDGLPGEIVSVTATATDEDGTVASTEWLIDGAVVATGTSAQLPLPSGSTVVSFRATDNTGASSTTSVTLTVAAPVLPVVSIEGGSRTVADTDGQPGEAVSLSATATDANGTIESSEWLIDGDVVASGLDATLNLPDGVSAITFRATDNDGFSSSTAINVTVVSPTPNAAPTVSITSTVSAVTDSDGKAGELVQLSSVASDSDGSIALTEWLLGDTVVASGPSVSVALPDGESSVTVRVTDNLGATASASTTINVSAPQAPVVNIVGGPLTVADSNNQPGEIVSLFANASDADGTIVSARWLNNGAAVAEGLVADLLLPDGTSDLVFEATDSQGLTSSASVTVTVQAPLPPPSQEDVQQATAQLNSSTSQVQQALQQSSGGNVSSETVAQARQMSQQAASSAESLARGVSSGTVDTTTALGALSGASSAASVSGQVGQAAGDSQSQQQLAAETKSIVRNSAAVLDALASSANTSGTGLTPDEQELVKQSSSALMQTAGGLSSSVQNAEELSALAQTTNQIIEANSRLGIPADENTVNQIREVSAQISTVAVKQALQASGNDLNLSDDDIKQLLTQNDQLLETVFQATLTVPPAVLVSQQQASQAVNDAAAADGVDLDADAAERLANTTRENVVRPGDVVVNGVSVLDLILNLFRTPTTATLIDANGRIASVLALEANDANIIVNEATGAVTVVLPGETYAGVIVAVRSVPATVPEGIRFRADGRGMIVSNGIAIELAPAPVDLLRFAAAVESSGFKFNMRKNASIWLDLGNGERFSGVLAYDNLTGINTANCGEITFIEPVGPVNSASYAFGVKCANGVVQTVQPFVDNASFLDSLSAAGFNARVDRNTGFVSVEGETFKPSFFVSPLTASERIYHAERKDSFGIAYQAIVHPDGRVDYKVISANGVQMLYGVR